MAPPTYSDLGKQAKDVFGKGYHFGVLKLECKSKTATGVEITAGGNNALESGKVSGNLETKYKIKEHGKLYIYIYFRLDSYKRDFYCLLLIIRVIKPP